MIKKKVVIKATSEEELIKLVQQISTLEDQSYTVYLCDKRPNRSLAQNRYLWGVIYKTLSSELGYHPEEIHEYFKKKFGFTTKFNIEEPRHVPISERKESYALNGDICDACGAECLTHTNNDHSLLVCVNDGCEIEWKVSSDGEITIVRNPFTGSADVEEVTLSTKFFDTKKMTDYIDKIIDFALNSLNIHIPAQGEITEEQYVEAMDYKL